ncbi:MAG: flagellar basal body P-ring formation chaperone FlgA [Alphaproteobacteria bacterium]
MQIKIILLLALLLPSYAIANEEKLGLIEELTEQIKEELIIQNIVSSETSKDEIDIIFDSKSESISKKSEKVENVNIIEIDKTTKNLKCKVKFIQNDKKTSEVLIIAKYQEFKLIPALKVNFTRGEVIEANDIENIKVNITKLKKNTIKYSEDLIGKTPRGSIRAFSMINISDVAEPNIVSKGDQLTVIYENSNLSIKISAIAMEAGAKNSIIRVKNLKTNTIFAAKIINKNNAQMID